MNMDDHDRHFLLGLMLATCLLLIWGGYTGAITIEQAGAVVRTLALVCLAWLCVESVQ